MTNNINIHHISLFAGSTLTGVLLLLLFVNYKFPEPYTISLQYSSGFGSGLSKNERQIHINTMLVDRVLGINSKAENSTQNCSDENLDMFVGLSESNLINFGYPADSVVLNIGEKPYRSKYGKRIFFEIGKNGKIVKAYCY